MNNPEIATAFKEKEVQLFLKRILRSLESNIYELKDLLSNGYEKYYDGIVKEFTSSYKLLESENINNEIIVNKVERIIDSKVFTVGDIISYGKSYGKEIVGVISRMYIKYEDDELKIRIGDPSISICWVDLNELN